MTDPAGGKNRRMPSCYREAVALMASQGGPWLLVLTVVGCLLLRASLGGVGLPDALVVLSFVSLRSFMEWALHTYIFNAAPLPWLKWRLRNPISAMHGEHHRDPHKIEALFFGWRGVAAVLAASYLFLFLLFRDGGLALSGLMAVATNLFLYEWCHVVSHSDIAPASPRFAAVIENHRKHHHVDGNRYMGVSSVLADKVFGTY